MVFVVSTFLEGWKMSEDGTSLPYANIHQFAVSLMMVEQRLYLCHWDLVQQWDSRQGAMYVLLSNP